MNTLMQKQEVLGINVPMFGITNALNIRNAQAPPKEVCLSGRTIDFLNNLGSSGFESSGGFVCGVSQGTHSNELGTVSALLQVGVGVICVMMSSNTAPGSTTTVMIKPEQRGRFSDMHTSLNMFVGLAKEVFPNMRELNGDEQKDLKSFFKKSYRKF